MLKSLRYSKVQPFLTSRLWVDSEDDTSTVLSLDKDHPGNGRGWVAYFRPRIGQQYQYLCGPFRTFKLAKQNAAELLRERGYQLKVR